MNHGEFLLIHIHYFQGNDGSRQPFPGSVLTNRKISAILLLVFCHLHTKRRLCHDI